MESKFKHIIWGASLRGIEKAIELQSAGESLILLNKLGFPGGKYTESLACHVPKEEIEADFIKIKVGESLRELKYGIIHESKGSYIVHPEAVKRVCWDLIRLHEINVLFHVNPLEIHRSDSHTRLTLFGREGKITVEGENFHDYSDDKYFSTHRGSDRHLLRANCFFRHIDSKFISEIDFKTIVPCELGHYVSLEKEVDSPENIEMEFNKMLDQMTVHAWEKFNSRVLMLPAYPEIITNY